MKEFKLKRQHLILTAIMVVSFFLNFLKVGQDGYGNTYYAATVKSMLSSLHNFFFVAFDPGGFMTVDKPPLGLWIQAISAMIFGFKGWSLILPEAIAGAISVGVLYVIVKKAAGKAAGFVAAGTLAITPVFVATNRCNIVDSLLVLAVLLAALAVQIATEKASLKWLVFGAILIGLGFNIKMLEAFTVLPALLILYLLGASLKLKKKIGHLAIAFIVLLAVSASWILIVDLTPKADRPYVGSSQTNSAIELTIGMNGVARIIPFRDEFFYFEKGDAGILRLFNEQMAGQASWLIIFVLIGIVLSMLLYKRSGSTLRNIKTQAVLMWSVWFFTLSIYFSIAGFFHRYYLSIYAPSIAALFGIFAIRFYNDFKEKGVKAWALPFAIFATAITQAVFLNRYPGWNNVLTPIILILCLASVLYMVAYKLLKSGRSGMLKVAAVLGLSGLLVAPAVWSLTPMLYGGLCMIPYAGPELSVDYLKAHRQDIIGIMRIQQKIEVPSISRFLKENKHGEKFIAVVPVSSMATPIILATGEPVMSLGGFMGTDKPLTLEKFKGYVDRKEVRYFITYDTPENPFEKGIPEGTHNEVVDWIRNNHNIIPSDEICLPDIEHNEKLFLDSLGGLLGDIGPGQLSSAAKGVVKIYDLQSKK